MPSLRWIAVPLALGLALPSFGCGLFRRNRVTTNVSSNVEINQQGRDIATLQRHEYEVLDSSMGMDESRQVYVLTIPVGSQTNPNEGIDNAYYDAVDRNPECDALLNTRVETKRIIIPLLLINVVVRKNRVKGRCIHILENDVLAGEEPEDEGGTDTGGGGDEPAGEPPAGVDAEPSEAGSAP